MTTWVIGDIQGCYREFRELLVKINFQRSKDTLWFVGDLVNRGPNNIDVLRYIMALPRTITVLGNHDLHFLAIARGRHNMHRGDTVSDLLEAPDLDDIVSWLRQQPLLHVDESTGVVLVHAGLPPIWSIAEARSHAKEIEGVLRGDCMDTFLSEMYGNEPRQWEESLQGFERLRLMTNYFTRLRYCTLQGELELKAKANIKPVGFDAWFSFPRPDHYRVLFGHWAAIDGVTGTDQAVALDTGCVWGRSLTALRLDTNARCCVASHTTAPD